MADTRTVVLSPHFDDAVLSAFHVVARGDVSVVTVFSEAPGDVAPEMFERRREDDVRALARFGVRRSSLGLTGTRENGSSAPPIVDVERAIAPLLDGADEVWAPAAIGRNTDHVLVRNAVVSGWRGLDGRRPRVRLYADMPYAFRRGLPVFLAPRPAMPPEAWWLADLRAVLRWVNPRPTTDRLGPEGRQQKLDAIRCYQTEYDHLGYGDVSRWPCSLDELVGFELSWTLR
jgi:LmbE family N-acetylglucosaminyl deacetylase